MSLIKRTCKMTVNPSLGLTMEPECGQLADHYFRIVWNTDHQLFYDAWVCADHFRKLRTKTWPESFDIDTKVPGER